MKSEVQKHEERMVLSQMEKAKALLNSAYLTVLTENLPLIGEGVNPAEELLAVITDLEIAIALIQESYIPVEG